MATSSWKVVQTAINRGGILPFRSIRSNKIRGEEILSQFHLTPQHPSFFVDAIPFIFLLCRRHSLHLPPLQTAISPSSVDRLFLLIPHPFSTVSSTSSTQNQSKNTSSHPLQKPSTSPQFLFLIPHLHSPARSSGRTPAKNASTDQPFHCYTGFLHFNPCVLAIHSPCIIICS